MRKEFIFSYKNYKIKIINSWSGGIKLYVDGDLRDHDTSHFANGKVALLSAKLGKLGILQVYPSSSFFSIEIDVCLIQKDQKQYLYSSHKRLPLKEQRLAGA